jgi:hypothetical protein
MSIFIAQGPGILGQSFTTEASDGRVMSASSMGSSSMEDGTTGAMGMGTTPPLTEKQMPDQTLLDVFELCCAVCLHAC